ncbi:M23 family metallopeptidase, partial [bacterium]|nr:M23 family metallopeptidase [candidate division CSSED10-310 bacterium]
GSGDVEIHEVIIEAVKEGNILQTLVFSREVLDLGAKRMLEYQTSGILKLYDFYFQTEKLIGQNTELAASCRLSPNTAIITGRRYLAVQSQIDSFRIRVSAESFGNRFTVESSIDATLYESIIDYHLPVKGNWYVAAAANPHSHHRWATNEEFALDLIQLGENGIFYRNKGSALSDHYCFGKEIFAVAEGKVVRVIDDFDDNEMLLQRDDETDDEFEQRAADYQTEILKNNPYQAAGNYIVIRHGESEYSFYAHLKNRSIRVSEGDDVKAKQLIAQIGNSGNSTGPHLHFQLSEGPDLLYSRALPIKFCNVENLVGRSDRHLQSGDLIITVEEHSD